MGQTPTLKTHYRLRLQSHFGFAKVPFNKNLRATHMFDARGQREMYMGLMLWVQVLGIALLCGPTGVGKSITIRRFLGDLDEQRFRVLHVTSIPSTTTGFLRLLNRALGLPMRQHSVDLFAQAQHHLTDRSASDGPHPLLVLDDAEGLQPDLLDILRRLTAYELDAEDRFSVIISGTEELLRTLRHPSLQPLCTRVSYANSLQGFTLEDTRNYVAFHMQRAGGPKDLITDPAATVLFHATQGRPRKLNQLALQALIQAAAEGRDQLDANFIKAVVDCHPLFNAGAS